VDLQRIAPAVPIVIGALIAVLWVTVQGTTALVFTIIGGAAIGVFYAFLSSRQDRERPDEPPL
jgi:hypothetical protein